MLSTVERLALGMIYSEQPQLFNLFDGHKEPFKKITLPTRDTDDKGKGDI